MIATELTRRLRIRHPVLLGGMATGNGPELVAAVSEAGGLGILGCSGRPPADVERLAGEIRSRTERPWGLNLLLFTASDEQVAAVLGQRPAVFSTAWPDGGRDLAALFARAHDAGCTVLHMVSRVDEAGRAAEAGADLIVAQGTEGGGHVGLVGSLVLVPQVSRAVDPLPVVAAGGIADGAGLAAALVLGAAGALMGTRFLATPESTLPRAYKEFLVGFDGQDTQLTEVPDITSGLVWPGAYARVARNRFVEEWIGREGELRRRQPAVLQRIREAAAAGDVEHGVLYSGQDAGLIEAIEPAGDVVRRVAEEAEALLRDVSGRVLLEEEALRTE
jgi:NAD(P)H-dependent flavin oxidoreductase YrpB (nitropropane dioxygenase family)